MSARRAGLLIAALLPLSSAAQPAATSDPLSAFKWFRDLAGACWKGDHPDGKTSDTQCYQLQYNRFVRGTIVIGSAGRAYEGDSLFWWDAKNARLAYTQWASNGVVVSNEAVFEGEKLVFPDRPRPSGEVTGRSVWTRLDADSYLVSRETRDGADWKAQFAVTYRRAK